jgi:uncharacterized protein
MRNFVSLFSGPHFQTIASHFWPRKLDTLRYPVEQRLYRTEPDVQVLVESQRPRGTARAELVMVHGLEGSGEAGYMRGLSQAALDAGFAAHRFHMRTCGGAEHLCKTLYHSGLTGDLEAVLREFAAEGRGPVFLAGFSLGGNVVLKLAGELGETAAALFRGVCAVSTPIDLAASCGRIGRWDNRLYERRFVRRLRRRLCAMGRYSPRDFRGVRSIRDVDERITAPAFGFQNAAHYYRTQSAARYLDSIRVPALLIQAKDDPLIPFGSYRHPAFETNPFLTLWATEHGGHVGFLARGAPRFWAEAAIVDWICSRIAGTNAPPPSSSP